MTIDLEPFFLKYEALLNLADRTFGKIRADFPDCVTCKETCADCCHALFDLPLIEALYINHHFHRNFSGKEREARLEGANKIDRKIYQIKRKAYKALEKGREEMDILQEMATLRVRCPLLNNGQRCDLYAYRPITCRIYGLPTSIGGRSHTCGMTGFKEGHAYPTVNIDVFQRKLYELSAELTQSIQSSFSRLAEMLVPLSMALLTDYNDEYLGIAPPPEKREAETGDEAPSKRKR